ncbi:MAG: C-terminal target protein [Ferruginibacter sp.]|nr:C-terminal target protein [Ferruginibacter sp.]
MRKINCICKIAILLFATCMLWPSVKAQQTLTQINGWNAYVHLPASYNSSSANYPTIIFFPGLGEVGNTASKVIQYGPGAYIAQGWNGNVTVAGSLVEFIVISLQTPNAFPNENQMNARIQNIKNNYRVDPNRLYLTGLSHGGWCSSTFVTGDNANGPYTYASQIAAVVTVQGMIPDDNQPYPNLFDNFANAGGKYLGFEQTLDGRDTRTVVDRMNMTKPNSAVYVQTSYGGGGHCCWSEYYGGNGTQPGTYMLQGVNQNIYQWMARQTLGPPANIPPTANAGTDKVIAFPVSSTTLTGSGSDPDGTITGYQWTRISGPASGTIVSPASAITNLINLAEGTYQYELKVTDNSGASDRDTVNVTVVVAGNQAPTANAGPDQTITLPTSVALLNGSGTDPDGVITNYNWAQLSGPNTATLTGAALPFAVLSNLVQGYYKFRLQVMDNNGAIDTDTVAITVNPVPPIPCNNLPGVKYFLSQTGAGEIYRPNGSAWKGGDTIVITGTNYSVIEFNNIGGDPCRPLVIMPLTTVSTPVFRIKGKSHHIKLWGGPTAYGIRVNGPLALTMCDHIEVNNIECYGGSNGIYCKQDPIYADPSTWQSSGYVMSNFKFRNIWVHDCDGEGMYIGVTQPDGVVRQKPDGSDTLIVPIRLDSVEISNCLVERSTWDGIQLSNARGGNKIFNNVVKNYGTINMSSQQAGIILGGNTSGDVYNNTIRQGTGNGMEIFGYGVINVYNNTLDSCGYDGTANGQQSIYASDFLISSDTNPKQTIIAYGNNINRPKTAGAIFITGYYNNSFPSSVYNNTFCIPGAPTNWQSTYLKLNVYGSVNTNNTLYCSSSSAPFSNAGPDQTISLPQTTAVLTGSGMDPDGTIVGYQWTKVSGPYGTILNSTNPTTNVESLQAGTYKFELLVTDNGGATARDTMQLNLVAPNQLPTVNAGPDQTIQLPVNIATLTAIASDSDGTITNYQWTKISGPAGGSIAASAAATTTLSGLQQGTYSFECKVTDNAGAIARDTVNVIVNSAGNIAPVANAGPDQTISLPVNVVNLSGAGTDADGIISSYQWVKISGPYGTILSVNAASTVVESLVTGTYKFELTVTDNNGATGKDTVQVTVNAPANLPPVAHAGGDQVISLPQTTATLNGSGTDADGTINAFYWAKLSGPSGGIIANPLVASAAISSLSQGVYKYELTVTDNSGASAKDTMQLTVNAAAPPPNILPVANAGPDQVVTLPVNNVSLNGVGTDADGTITGYQWTKISGPAAGTINNSGAPTATAVNLVQAIYLFELTVTDNNGATAKDTVQVTVNPAANIPPTAIAGNDQVITLPVNSVNLNGSGTDPDGNIVIFSWNKISGPTAGIINNPNALGTSVTGMVQGLYKFELTLVDNNGAAGKDTMEVLVNPALNLAPIANAGTDKVITLPVNSLSFTGAGTDTDGTITAYQWLKISGPAAGTLTNASVATTSAINLVQGVYQFELTVTDNNGATGKDTMQVIVNAALNIAPVANAGADKIITLPVNTVSIIGNGTDTDGIIANYQWLKISGPAAGTLSNASASTTSAINLVQGIYQFELTVTDNNGATGKDTMQVFVNAAPNIAPTAIAGNDQVITLPLNSINLNGSGTDPDGTIVGFLWTKISGPSAGNISNPNGLGTTVTGMVQGTYRFELTLTDNNGGIGRDTMQVIVNPAPNVAPTAYAGNDQTIQLPVNSVNLSGSGTDSDGFIAAYQWTKILGPSATIISANASATTVSGLVQGIYVFELRVTDNNGAIAKDTMQVTVLAAPNLPPTANAGADQDISLPVNLIGLLGAGTDPDGSIVGYQWTKIAGPTAVIGNPNAIATSVSGLIEGTYSFELKVTDNNGASAKDTMQVFVHPAPVIPNVAPVAHAGSAISILFPVNNVDLTGWGTDADGTIVSYQWRVVSGPVPYTLVTANQPQTAFRNLVEGIYVLELTVTDNNGATGKDIVQVTVGNSRLKPDLNDVQIYPNPVTDQAHAKLYVTKDKTAKLVLTDARGAILMQKEVQINSVLQEEVISMRQYPAGIYFLKLESPSTKPVSRKIVKL